MNSNVEITGPALRLKTLRVRDITQAYIDGLNDPEVNRFLVNVRLTRQDKKTVTAFIRQNLVDPGALLLGIFKKPGTLIGTVRISEISNFHRFCSVGICVFDKASWGKGYATWALTTACGFIFKKLRLRYIEAGVYASNRASLGLFRRAGFKVVARYENKYRYDKDFVPVVIWGKTR